MPKIRLTTFTGKLEDGKDIEVSTIKYILIALESGSPDPAKGLTWEEILDRTRLDRILEKVKPEDTEVYVDGDNFATLKKAMALCRWSGRNKIISELIEDIFEAKEDEAPAVKKLKAVKD